MPLCSDVDGNFKMLVRGGSLLAAVRRFVPFGSAAASLRTRIGIQMRGDALELARVNVTPGAMPRVEQLQSAHVEQARRGEAIRRLAHSGLLRDAQLRLVLTAGEYDLYQLPAPNVPEEELRDALRWQLRGTLPYAPEDAEIDFVHIPTPTQDADNASNKAAVLVVAAPRATVEQLVAPFTAVGVEVGAVDVPEFSQRNLAMLTPLSPVMTSTALLGPSTRIGLPAPTQTVGCQAWLSFDRDACVLTVQTGAGHAMPHELCFTRRIHIPGADGSGVNPAFDTDQSVNYLIERIVTQVQRSLDVFERQSGQAPVALLTVGPHRYGIAIAQTLSDRLALVCHTFEPDSYLQLVPGLPGNESMLWGNGLAALGAALRIEHKVSTEGQGLAARLLRRLRGTPAAEKRAA